MPGRLLQAEWVQRPRAQGKGRAGPTKKTSYRYMFVKQPLEYAEQMIYVATYHNSPQAHFKTFWKK